MRKESSKIESPCDDTIDFSLTQTQEQIQPVSKYPEPAFQVDKSCRAINVEQIYTCYSGENNTIQSPIIAPEMNIKILNKPVQTHKKNSNSLQTLTPAPIIDLQNNIPQFVHILPVATSVNSRKSNKCGSNSTTPKVGNSSNRSSRKNNTRAQSSSNYQ